MEEFEVRLIKEKEDLEQKIVKLGAFLDSDKFNEIELVQQSLLNIQFLAMTTYLTCLQERIDWLN